MRGKLLVAAVSALLALIAGLQVLRSLDVGAWRPVRRPHIPLQGAVPVVRTLDEAFALELWGERPGFQYDPVAHFARVPGMHQPLTWPEYPSGEMILVTNEQGFREDRPTLRSFAGPRVLVAGDSHTDGLVENRLSFANVAERELATAMGQEVDVVNAGVGFTGPRCYLGMLKKCLELEPDVFVAVLFTGNDFSDDLWLAYKLGERVAPAFASGEYRARANEVAADYGPFFQGLNQAYRFKANPGEGELALTLVLESLFAIDELCRARGIAFLLVLLPTKMDVEDDGREAWLAASARLGLAESDPALNLELGRRALAAARERGIDCLDPTDAMRAASTPLYWVLDHHLGLEGHALLGTLIAARLRAILDQRR